MKTNLLTRPYIYCKGFVKLAIKNFDNIATDALYRFAIGS